MLLICVGLRMQVLTRLCARVSIERVDYWVVCVSVVGVRMGYSGVVTSRVSFFNSRR